MTKKQVSQVFKKTHFFLDLFGINCHFTNSKDELIAMCNHMGADHGVENGIGGRCLSLQNYEGMWRILIYAESSGAVLVHECVHAASFIMNIIGQELKHNYELLPYLTQWFYEQCEAKLC